MCGRDWQKGVGEWNDYALCAFCGGGVLQFIDQVSTQRLDYIFSLPIEENVDNPM